MAICDFCGKEIPDGSVCDCMRELFGSNFEYADENAAKPEAQVENKAASAVDVRKILSEIQNKDDVPQNFFNERHFVPPLDDVYENTAAESYSAPVRKKSRVTKKVLRRRRLYAIAVIFLLIFGVSFVRNHTGCRGTVHEYWNCVVDENGGKTYYTLGLPQILINHFESTGEWDGLINNYENLSKDAVKLKKIKKIKKMTKDELHDAEEYLNKIALMYGVEVPNGSIIADSGYFVTVIYKFGDDNVIGGAYYVQIEGEGWKVLPHDMTQ